jgi:hypothetical protein
MNYVSLGDLIWASIDSFSSSMDEEAPFSEIEGMLLAIIGRYGSKVTR